MADQNTRTIMTIARYIFHPALHPATHHPKSNSHIHLSSNTPISELKRPTTLHRIRKRTQSVRHSRPL
ncbi:hypothetical protein BJY04DRAFT_196309 [Aspergillus karnatakaensis]|uniref:uncharacterized protein n=1 Tax=Aspergillus karnatakaensis TaxID=1810916 RepID=UPI003CCCDCCD